MGNIALIDGDSISFIVGWACVDHQNIPLGQMKVDAYMNDMFTITKSSYYMGALGCPGDCFRKEIYKVKPYKAGRVLDEHMKFWRPVIDQYLRDKYGFVSIEGLEADDIIAYMSTQVGEDQQAIICSPDKDLKQLPCNIYNFQKNEWITLTQDERIRHFWWQMIVGDSGDNVAGIISKGEKYARDVMNGTPTEELPTRIKEAYLRYFGPYYGTIIYGETLNALKLMIDSHPLYPQYQPLLAKTAETCIRETGLLV